MFTSYNFSQAENDALNYYFFQQGFSSQELKRIEQGIQSLELHKAVLIGEEDSAVRSSKVRWIPQDDNWFWLYEKLSNMIVEANNALWHFDLNNMPELIQFTEYYASENGHYTWHQDIGPGMASRRKISITVQLSDPEQYDGGELQLWQGGLESGAITAHKGEGSVFIFPSYMMHRVTPVTRGVRKSFVLWVGGSHYR